MASLDTGGDGGHGKKGPGVKKAKKLSTRVDMTPMVDLGFLLITFFIFTTTMSTPTTVNLNMPKDTDKDEEKTKTKQSGALTIMLGKNNNVYYYEGELDEKNASSVFTRSNFADIRKEIIKKKQQVISNYHTDAECEKKARDKGKDPIRECQDQDLVVIIKPTDDATYKNAVDILDEMTINKVKRYAIVKISDTEKNMVAASDAAGK